MRIGITGGTGNISLYITRRLVRAGHHVVIFNRSGTTVGGARTVQIDRTNTDDFVEAVRSEHLDVGIDMIVFTAADARVSLEAFSGVEQLIHCSTGATYGFPLPLPVTEEAPLRARYPALEERNFWHHMDVSNAKLKRVAPSYHQAHTLEDGLADILAGFDPNQVEPNSAEIDAMLDDLAERQGRVLR
jgi:nucleoside-diphosphate-sugar epimerase